MTWARSAQTSAPAPSCPAASALVATAPTSWAVAFPAFSGSGVCSPSGSPSGPDPRAGCSPWSHQAIAQTGARKDPRFQTIEARAARQIPAMHRARHRESHAFAPGRLWDQSPCDRHPQPWCGPLGPQRVPDLRKAKAKVHFAPQTCPAWPWAWLADRDIAFIILGS